MTTTDGDNILFEEAKHTYLAYLAFIRRKNNVFIFSWTFPIYLYKKSCTNKQITERQNNRLDLLDEPLDRRWLERAKSSHSAEPLSGPVYRQAPLSSETRERLRQHPQFSNAPKTQFNHGWTQVNTDDRF